MCGVPTAHLKCMPESQPFETWTEVPETKASVLTLMSALYQGV